jgi:hypothetical protein
MLASTQHQAPDRVGNDYNSLMHHQQSNMCAYATYTDLMSPGLQFHTRLACLMACLAPYVYTVLRRTGAHSALCTVRRAQAH